MKEEQKQMKLDQHIFLIGFMGCGKSTCAACLCRMTGAEQIEMDQEIVKRQGMEITEIFRVHGEEYFRDLETDLIKEIGNMEPMVVSCGGGTVLREENVALMKAAGRIVLLTAEPETVFDRVKGSADRPVLNGNMNLSYIKELMEARRPRYEAAADAAVATDGRTAEEICEEILEQRKEGSHGAVEFRDMEYVMAVHEEQSFSGAARKHFISPPVLSRVVRKVERNLGVTLFDRSSIPLKPTPQGQKVLEYFEQMQKLRMELEQYCETAGQQGGPGLTVAAPSFFCTYGLPPVIAAFKERYPDWEIRLVEANDRDLVDFLRAGVAELGISANGDTAPDMESEVLRMENIILAVPAGFAVNRGLEAYALDPARGNDVPGVPLEQFAGERFLFMKPGNDMRERGMRLCREAGFSPRIVMELDQMMTAYYLAAAGEGAAFIRAGLLYYAGGTEKLRFYRIDSRETVRPIRILWRQRGERTARQRGFVEFLKSWDGWSGRGPKPVGL